MTRREPELSVSLSISPFHRLRDLPRLYNNTPKWFSWNTSKTLKTSVRKMSPSLRMQPTATHKHAITTTSFWRQKKAVLSQSRCAQLSAAAACHVEVDTAADGRKWIANICFTIFWWMKSQTETLLNTETSNQWHLHRLVSACVAFLTKSLPNDFRETAKRKKTYLICIAT